MYNVESLRETPDLNFNLNLLKNKTYTHEQTYKNDVYGNNDKYRNCTKIYTDVSKFTGVGVVDTTKKLTLIAKKNRRSLAYIFTVGAIAVSKTV